MNEPMQPMIWLKLGLLVILALSGCGQLGLSEAEYYERALQHQASGDLPAAAIDFKNALQKNSANAEARLGLGLVSLELGDLATARIELQRASELGMKAEALRVPFARLWLASGEHDRVIAALPAQGVAELDHVQRAEVFSLRGEALSALGRDVEAIESVEEAISVAPEREEPHLAMAAIHLRASRLSEARASLATALAINEGYKAWDLLGDLERTEGHLEQAVVAYGRALESSPSPYFLHYKRALTRMTMGDIQGMEHDLGAMRRLAPRHPATAYVEGLAHFHEERYAEAQAAFQQSISVYEDFQPALFFLGASLFAQQQWDQAENVLRRVLRINPQSDEAARLLAAIRLQEGDVERAEALLRPLLSRRPDDILALSLMSDVHLALGRHDEGIANLRELVSLQPDDTVSRVRLASGLLEAGQLEASLAEFEGTLRQAPTGYQAEIAYVVGLIQQGEFDAALVASGQLIERLPASPIPHNLKAGAHLGKGEFVLARGALVEALRLAPGDPMASKNLAQLALAAGETEEARRIYREALQHNPGDVDVTMHLIRLEAQRGDVDAVRALLEKSMSHHPEALAPRLELARYHLFRNEPRRALILMEPVRQSAAGDPDMLELRARAEIAAGMNSQALATLRALAARVPATGDAYHALAENFERAGSQRDARSHYRKALELEPSHPATLRSLALLELREGQVDEALNLSRRMQQDLGSAAAGHAIEGRIHTDAGRQSDAIRSLEQAYELQPSANHAVWLATVQQQSGKTQEAVSLLSGRLANHPDEITVRIQLAHGLLELGEHDAAMREYEEILRTQPENAAVLNNLAYLYGMEGDERALEFAERAHALSPASPVVADTLGWILVQRGEIDRGLALLITAREGLPELPDVGYHLAVALVKAGREAEARQELTNVLENPRPFLKRQDAEALLETLR